MTALLSIALLIIGTTATLAAFGGETYERGNRRLSQRIKPRGWVSLVCLALALLVGIWKEAQTHSDDVHKRHENLVAADEARQAQKNLACQLETAQKSARRAEEKAEQNLVDLRGAAKFAEDQQRKTQATLDETRNDLNRQSTASLVTALASSDLMVRDIRLTLPLTARANRSDTLRGALLPRLNEPACRDLTNLRVYVVSLPGEFESVDFRMGDSAHEHRYFSDDVPKIDSLDQFPDKSTEAQTVSDTKASIGQRSFNGFTYRLQIHTLDKHVSAARMYGGLVNPRSRPFYIEASWPPFFQTREQVRLARVGFPNLPDPSLIPFPENGLEWEMGKYPASCAREIQRYFSTAFDKAYFTLLLDKKPDEYIAVKLRALPIELFNQQIGPFSRTVIRVPFSVFSTPIFLGGQNDTVVIDWPKSHTSSHAD